MFVDMNFVGVWLSSLGVIVKSHRDLTGERNESLMEVSGRNGFVDQGVHEFKFKRIGIEGFTQAEDIPKLRENARNIAALLAKSGDMYFSDEPDKVYKEARVYAAAPLEQMSTVGTWSMEFKVQPFATGKTIRITQSGIVPVSIPIPYGGTAPTSCRIIIRNMSETDAANITVTQYMQSAQGGK